MEQKAKRLLEVMPGSYCMLTIAPQAASRFAESVRYVYGLGYRKITASPALGKRVTWTDAAMEEMGRQLSEISEFYEECYLRKDKFFFSPFDAKINNALTGKNPAERCHLGMRQMPVDTDGKIYACTQFIGDEKFCLGDVFNGLDREKVKWLVRHAPEMTEDDECRECDLRARCVHTCGCSNRMATGNENRVSAEQCTYEKTVIALSDALADRLFEADRELFMKTFG